MMTRSERLEPFLEWWMNLNISDRDAHIMAQIECMLDERWEQSQKTSAELGIPFATHFHAHYKIHEHPGDKAVFYRYWECITQSTKDLLWHGAIGMHVQTWDSCKKYFKQDLVDHFGLRTDAY